MSGLRVREVRFKICPQDHDPRHVHGYIGSGAVIVDLKADGSVALADRKDNIVGRIKNNEVRKVLEEAGEAFNQLVELWEAMHT